MSTNAFVSTRMPVELRNRLKAVAAKRGVSLQRLMQDAVETFLAEAEREPPQLADVIAQLRAHAPEMQKRGVTHLWVFGSVARGEAGIESDVDLAIDVDEAADFSLITLGSVAHQAEAWLERPVDLGERRALRSSLRPEFERDAVRVF